MKSRSSSKTALTIGLMAILIFCAKFMGLLREIIIASIYGQGFAADVLNSATQIPLLFFDMTLGIAILSTFVPIFNNYLEKNGRDRAMEFAGNFMTVTITLATVLALIGVIFAEPIVRLMAPGYDAQKTAETAKLLRVLFPSIIFTTAAYTSVGILQSFGEFNVPSIISVVSNLIMIVYLIIFGNRYGLVGVIISMVIAWASQLFIQIPWLIKFGFRYRPQFNLRDEGLISAAKLAVPVLISSWVQPLCSVINMAFGSSLGDGAVAGLGWANKIYIIMVGVFAYAFTNFIFPKLSRMSAGDRNDEFSETTRISIGWIAFIITWVAAMFIALSEPIIEIVFQRGQFTREDTILTASALFCYSFGMVGYAVCEILNKSFYAVQDGKTPMITSIIGIIVNFLSAFVLVKYMKLGIRGLALASAVSSIVMGMVLIVAMNHKKPHTFDKIFLFNIIKILICGVGAFFVASVAYPHIAVHFSGWAGTFASLCISALLGITIYTALAFLLKADEIKQIRRVIRGK